MEKRSQYGPAIDISTSCSLPTLSQLIGIIQSSNEFQVMVEGDRVSGLRLQSASRPKPRVASLHVHSTLIVMGGTKVTSFPIYGVQDPQGYNHA